MSRAVSVVIVMVVFAGMVCAQSSIPVSNYLYFSEFEQTEFEETIWFWQQDYLRGPVRSNDQIAIKNTPIFTDSVITTAAEFLQGSGFNPSFLGPAPRFNAPPLVDTLFYARLDSTAWAAQVQGFYFANTNRQRQTRFVSTVAGWRVLQWPAGIPYPEDESDLLFEEWIDYGSRRIFVEGDLELAGVHVQGETYIACSGNMYLIDDVQYEDLRDWRGQPGSIESDYVYEGIHKLILIAGENILVANTEANGSQSGGLIGAYDDPTNKHILITARLETPNGSFTFENQNNAPDDPNGWDGYWWCDPEGQHRDQPDERGIIFVYGGLAQQRRGYVHRSNCGGTGYSKRYMFDARFVQDGFAGFVPMIVDVSEGDVEWSDTTIAISPENRRIVLEGEGSLIIGPGTEFDVNVAWYDQGKLFEGDNIFLSGEEGNPVVFRFEQEGEDYYAPFAPGQIGSAYLEYVDFYGARLQLDVPYSLNNCQIRTDEAELISSNGYFYITGCNFEGNILINDPINRLTRTTFEGTLDVHRIIGSENCLFVHRPDVPADTVALRILSRDMGRLDRLKNVYFQGDYQQLATTRIRLQVRYCAWSSDQPTSRLFVGDIEYEGSNLNATPAHFWDGENGDYHLREGSPLIDAGDPESELDPDGSRADIGVFPYDPTYVDAPETDPETAQPLAFSIETLYPNPFNGMTTLSLTLPYSGKVDVLVYDVLGRVVQQQRLGTLGSGHHAISLNLEEQSSGVYFIETRFEHTRSFVKALLIQ